MDVITRRPEIIKEKLIKSVETGDEEATLLPYCPSFLYKRPRGSKNSYELVFFYLPKTLYLFWFSLHKLLHTYKTVYCFCISPLIINKTTENYFVSDLWGNEKYFIKNI